MAGRRTLPGLLLLDGEPKRVDTWVERGVVPAYVVDLDGWTGVVPAGPAQAPPPYDDALTVMANMPVPMPLRATLGFFAIGPRAVMTVHLRAWRSLPRWLIWEPARGLARANLPVGSPADLVSAAGVVDEAVAQVRAALEPAARRPIDVLCEVLHALALPGAGLLAGHEVKQSDDAMLVEPHHRSVTRFGKLTAGDESS